MLKKVWWTQKDMCGSKMQVVERKLGNDAIKHILGFSGIKTKLTSFGPSNTVSDETRNTWITKVEKMGRVGN